MAKLVFPAAEATYRGIVGQARTEFQRLSSYCKASPDAKPEIAAQMAVLATDLGYTLTETVAP